MILQLKQHLSAHFSFLEHKKLLLAVSGGLDSMVMLHAFQHLDYNITIAHCNFNLRGHESDEDQKFVTTYAQKHDIPIKVNSFNTAPYAKKQKLSIQVAARTLRYAWFYDLIKEHELDYILTAHHADDTIETVLINLIRGTGIEGLTGIPQQNWIVLRPLLIFEREELKKYATENNILWREDSSNASDKYMRNKIRQDMIPTMKSLQPHFMTSFQNTLANLQGSKRIIENAIETIYKEISQKKGNQMLFDLEKINKLPHRNDYLHFLFHRFGFTNYIDIARIIDSIPGKCVYSDSYRLVRDRKYLILDFLKPNNTEHYSIHETDIIRRNETREKEYQTPNRFPIQVREVPKFIQASDSFTIFVDSEKLQFPLVIRRWQEGDTFYPLGMRGQKKKVSKYYKDEKLSLIDKEKTWILCSNGQIVWIIGRRMDERFNIVPTTKLIYQITWLH